MHGFTCCEVRDRAMLANDPLKLNYVINPRSINLDMVLYHVMSFFRNLEKSKILLMLIVLQPTEKSYTYPFNLVSFHVIERKVFQKITYTQYILFYFEIF